MLESKQGIVSKFKTLNQNHKKLQTGNNELLLELNRLKAAGGNSAAPTKAASAQELAQLKQ